MRSKSGREGGSSSARVVPALVSVVALGLAAVLVIGMWREALRYRVESTEGLALLWSTVGTAVVAASAMPLAFATWTASRTPVRYVGAFAVVFTAWSCAWIVRDAVHG